MNWAKIQVAKTRKFGNEQWGKNKPPSMKKKTNFETIEDQTPKISEAEKKRLHKDFITKNLIRPFEKFTNTGMFTVKNFGGMIYRELEKYDLIESDVSKLDYIKKGIEARKEKLKRGSIRKAMNEKFDLDDETNLEMELIKDSFITMRESNVNLKEIIKL